MVPATGVARLRRDGGGVAVVQQLRVAILTWGWRPSFWYIAEGGRGEGGKTTSWSRPGRRLFNPGPLGARPFSWTWILSPESQDGAGECLLPPPPSFPSSELQESGEHYWTTGWLRVRRAKLPRLVRAPTAPSSSEPVAMGGRRGSSGPVRPSAPPHPTPPPFLRAAGGARLPAWPPGGGVDARRTRRTRRRPSVQSKGARLHERLAGSAKWLAGQSSVNPPPISHASTTTGDTPTVPPPLPANSPPPPERRLPM